MFILLCVLQTVFQFEVDQYHFKEALLRFAQFFVAPLLKASSTDRELEAVDSGKYDASSLLHHSSRLAVQIEN